MAHNSNRSTPSDFFKLNPKQVDNRVGPSRTAKMNVVTKRSSSCCPVSEHTGRNEVETPVSLNADGAALMRYIVLEGYVVSNEA